MPRRPRAAIGGLVFHILNRAAGRRTIFETDADYVEFQRVLEEARHIVPMRLLAYTLMPNHWHLILWPQGDDDLSNFMHWLTVTHTKRWHLVRGTSGTGPVYQGRFKSFPIETDESFLRVCRYVERNALRANLVQRAELWRWSSLWQHHNQRSDVSSHSWPVPRPANWLDYVNSIETETELKALRKSVMRGTPFGASDWRKRIAVQLGIESTMQLRGRPPK